MPAYFTPMVRALLAITLLISSLSTVAYGQTNSNPPIESLLKLGETVNNRPIYTIDLGQVSENVRLNFVNSLYGTKVLTVVSPCNASTGYAVKVAVNNQSAFSAELSKLYNKALSGTTGTEELKKKFDAAN